MHSSIQSYTQFWHPRERYENKVLYFISVNELDLATPQDLLLWSQPALYYALAFLFFGYVVNLPLSFISTLQAIATIFTLSEMLSSHFDLRLDSDSSQRILPSQVFGEVFRLQHKPKIVTNIGNRNQGRICIGLRAESFFLKPKLIDRVKMVAIGFWQQPAHTSEVKLVAWKTVPQSKHIGYSKHSYTPRLIS